MFKQPRRQRRRARQQRDHRRDPEAARRAREAARLRDARALAAGGHDGEDPERAHGADDAVWTAGRRARARGGRRHAGDRRQGEARHQDRAVGLPLLRREGAQGEVRPRRRTRSSPTSSSRSMREGMFWAAGQLYGFTFTRDHRQVPVFHPDVRVWEVTTRRRASTSACGTSIPTRAPASARARG